MYPANSFIPKLTPLRGPKKATRSPMVTFTLFSHKSGIISDPASLAKGLTSTLIGQEGVTRYNRSRHRDLRVLECADRLSHMLHPWTLRRKQLLQNPKDTQVQAGECWEGERGMEVYILLDTRLGLR